MRSVLRYLIILISLELIVLGDNDGTRSGPTYGAFLVPAFTWSNHVWDASGNINKSDIINRSSKTIFEVDGNTIAMNLTPSVSSQGLCIDRGKHRLDDALKYSFTISTWAKLKLNASDTPQNFITLDTYGTYSRKISLGTSQNNPMSRFHYQIGQSSAANIISPNDNLVDNYLNQWTHIVSTYFIHESGETNLMIYVNGQLKGNISLVEGVKPAPELSYLILGSHMNTTTTNLINRFRGSLTNIKIYPLALSRFDIYSIYINEKYNLFP